jgi:hypothetical protein
MGQRINDKMAELKVCCCTVFRVHGWGCSEREGARDGKCAAREVQGLLRSCLRIPSATQSLNPWLSQQDILPADKDSMGDKSAPDKATILSDAIDFIRSVFSKP